jgi:hypothetical protein
MKNEQKARRNWNYSKTGVRSSGVAGVQEPEANAGDRRSSYSATPATPATPELLFHSLPNFLMKS